MAKAWTDEWVSRLERPGKGKQELVFHDPTMAKHRLVVKRTKKVFEVQAERPRRHRVNGKRKTYVVQIGLVPPMTVDEARAKAGAVIGQIAAGINPHRKADRPEETSPAVTTLGAAWAEFKSRNGIGPRTLELYEYTYACCLKHWDDEPLANFAANPVMARDEHRRLTKQRGPSTANKAMRLLRAIHRHAAKLDITLSFERHPCTAVDFHDEKPREGAAIPAALMPAWAAQVEKLRKTRPLRASFQVLCLRTGCRPGELAARKWSDVDYERNLLVLPETKTHLVEVPLTPQILAELERVREIGQKRYPDSPYIFPSSGGCIDKFTERKAELSHSGNCGRHTHHTIGTLLGPQRGIDELTLDVLEGRSLLKAGLAGRGYIDRSELGPKVRAAQQMINDQIDRLLTKIP